MSKDCLIVACPDYAEFKEAPKDQPNSSLYDCPICKKQMWMSAKKKGSIMLAACLGKDIILRCYPCLLDWAKENKEDFIAATMMRI
jgi:hypothetical protein